MTPNPETTAEKPAFSARRVLILGVPAALICGAALFVLGPGMEYKAQRDGEQTMLNWFGMAATGEGASSGHSFTDADGDGVADAPADPKDQVAPEVLLFSYVAAPEADANRAAWQDFAKHLEKATGKKVEVVAFETTEDQCKALSEGKLHVTGLNTGAVPTAVSAFGFVPVCTLGRDDGSFGSSMRIIVPAKSQIQNLADVKGRTVTFATKGSNSGCKAALVRLRDVDLLPERDYQWKFSGGQEESIKGVAAGEFQVAAVSDDLLQTLISQGNIEKDSVRSIYESERFPPATLGYVYNLNPELAGKIKGAFLDFSWTGTGLEKQFTATGSTKFVPITYKQDFAIVRTIDGALRKPSAHAMTD